MEEPKTEAERNLEPNLLKTIRRFSLMVELIHDVALMRYNQKGFFRERENEKLKREFLTKSKEYEKKVDALLDLLWPGAADNLPKQTKLF
jgi:hypothetical protein